MKTFSLPILALAITGTLTIETAGSAGATTPFISEAQIQIAQSTKSLDSLEQRGDIETAVDTYPTVLTDGQSSELQNGGIGLKTESGAASYLGNKIVTIADDHNIIYESLQSGDSRAVVQIESPESPTEFSFELTGNYNKLAMREDGGIDIIDEKSNVVASLDAPWAYDADGDAVPTYFTLDGNTVTQVVQHDASFDYGIVADPTLRDHIKK